MEDGVGSRENKKAAPFPAQLLNPYHFLSLSDLQESVNKVFCVDAIARMDSRYGLRSAMMRLWCRSQRRPQALSPQFKYLYAPCVFFYLQMYAQRVHYTYQLDTDDRRLPAMRGEEKK